MSFFTQTKGGRLVLNLLAALVAGLLLAWSAVLLTAQRLSAAASLCAAQPLAFLLTVLFFTLLIFILGLLLGRLFWGMVPVTAVSLLILLINYYKELITATPLELADFKLVGQLGDIAGLNAQSITFTALVLWSVLPPILCCVAAWVLSPRLDLKDLRWRLCAAGECALLFLLVFVARAGTLVYAPLGVPLDTGLPQEIVNLSTFTPLGLWRTVLYRDIVTEDYTPVVMESEQSRIEQLISDVEDTATDVRPNVILILSESFSDVTKLPGVSFQSDPLEEFHALQAQSVSGVFHSRTLGYGTCNIELEVLTGINNRLLSYGEELSHFDPLDLGVFPSLPSLFREAGYYTSFLHVYYDSIYHRAELFSHLGFDDMFFIEDIPSIDPNCQEGTNYWPYLDTKRSGYDYYSDQYLAELLIHQYETHGENGPVFLYGVSMENHAPYTADKYDDYDYSFTTDAVLSQDAQDSLSAYVQGLSDTSESLQILTDYFSQVEEPTILVFYGDHRPGLGLESGLSVYHELGLYEGSIAAAELETRVELYATDYLIWSNDPTLLRDPVDREVDSSSNFLGLDLLKTAGLELPRYWKLVDVLRQNSLIYTWSYFLDSTGTPSLTLPDESSAKPFHSMAYALSDGFQEQFITQWLGGTCYPEGERPAQTAADPAADPAATQTP